MQLPGLMSDIVKATVEVSWDPHTDRFTITRELTTENVRTGWSELEDLKVAPFVTLGNFEVKAHREFNAATAFLYDLRDAHRSAGPFPV